MDKGYDYEAIHQQILKGLHTNSANTVLKNNEISSITHRQEMARQFNDIVYPRRQLIEKRFSILKRKFNCNLTVRSVLSPMKEIAGKMIICNIHTFLNNFLS
jgi:hypothetical protein